MKAIKFLITVLLIISITACSSLSKKAGESIEEMIKKGLYHQALFYVEKNSPEYARLIKLIQAYEKSFPKKLADHITHQRWEKVNELIKEAELRIPESEVFAKAKEQWKTIQEQQQARLDAIRTIADAESLHKKIILDSELLRIDPDNFSAKWRHPRLINEGKEYAEILFKLSQKALQDNNLTLAEQTLTLAIKLDDRDTSKQAYDELSKKIAEQKKLTQELQQRIKQQRTKVELEQLLTELNKALSTGDLEKAQQLFSEAESIDSNNEKVLSYKSELDTKIKEQIAKYLEEGIKLYSREEFDNAIASWNKILKLDPENRQAHINIMRAEQVLENLRKLFNKE